MYELIHRIFAMTGGKMIFISVIGLQWGVFLTTLLDHKRTSRMKTTTGRWIDRAGNVSGEDYAFEFVFDIRRRNGGK